MSQTLTSRVEAIKNTPDTGEQVQISEFNSAFDKFDNHFIPAAKMRSSVTQSIPTSSTTQITFNQTVFDTYAGRPEGPMADLSNERITIRRDGIYLLTARIVYVNNVTGYRGVSIKNGAQILTRNTQDGNTQNGVDTGMQVSDIFSLANGDLITATAIQTSGAGLNLDPTINGLQDAVSLSVVWIGSAVEV